MSTATSRTKSPWLQRTPNGGLRTSKASQSVLYGAVPVLARIDESSVGSVGAGPSRRRFGLDKQRSASTSSVPDSPPMVEVLPLTPTTPPHIRHHPYADARPSNSSDDDESSGEEVESRAPRVVVDGAEGSEGNGSNTRSISMSPRSARTINTSATDESTAQIVRAQRIHRARAHSHSIDEIRQLLSPPPDSTFHRSLPPPLHIEPSVLGNNSTLRPLPNEVSGPSILSPGTPGPASQLTPRSLSPVSPNPPPALPPRSTARRRPRMIVKDMGSLLEHINEDECDTRTRLNSLVRTARSVSLPGIARQCSDSDPNVVSLPPPPRPRNRALVRTVSAAVHAHTLSGTSMDLHSVSIQRSETPPTPALVLQPPPRRSSLSGIRESPPPTPSPKDRKYVPTLRIPPPSRRESLDHHRWSLYSLPLTPVGIPLPPSTATPNFPQSPQSTVFHTTKAESPPATPQRPSFLPSCKATSVNSSAIREDWPSPRPSEDRSNRLSTLSNPFGDFSFLRPLANNRVSGISFSSNVSGSSARSATEAESIPIGLHRATSQDADHDDFLLPVSPRSSWLRSGFEVDVHLPGAYEDEEDDESVTEESSEKSSILNGRERSKSVTLPYIPSSSLKKAARVLGISGGSLLYQHVHDPHFSSPSPMSSSPENPTPTATTGADTVQQSFLPSTAPPSAFSMGNLGRRLSKRSSPSSSERRRSEDVPRMSSQASGGLMARMDRFMGRTPSPAGRTRELESEDELPSPPPILTFPKATHGRKHSSSDPSAGLASTTLTGRPSTSNMRTAAERAELVKKTRKIQQMLGDVPPVPGTAGTAFYRVSRAARSEDSLVTPTSARGEVVMIGGSADVRGHRSTASLSSRPLLALSPALQTDGLLDIKTSGSGEDFSVALNEATAVPETDYVDLEEHEKDEDEDESVLSRRAKRAKVAKLNRYLGSRVPAHLVLGMNEETWDYEQGLPRARSEDEESGSVFSGKKKRRASDGDYPLLEEEINDLSVMSTEEKARAVRRKAKMEKMFGERPPQKLYQVQIGADGPSKSVSDHESEPEDEDEDEDDKSLEGTKGGAHYQSYRASFNSLAYFVSNADRDSLEGLYDIISGPSESDSAAQRNQFAARRKRAAKLSNFFGVSYRDLFGAVLDILESDVKEDKEEGSLSAAETQDLLRKLKSLKDKGQGISV
ncbi:unnamed protein product [Rhizoctonia solani]|uniref:Uncharacterized protein n=1 Tax=Rhizoctonia solani TaxID=456999 RepID=A0A8H2WUL4_9AGAM|nr:unnamed protein product [Rhizoctonia solani]